MKCCNNASWFCSKVADPLQSSSRANCDQPITPCLAASVGVLVFLNQLMPHVFFKQGMCIAVSLTFIDLWLTLSELITRQ